MSRLYSFDSHPEHREQVAAHAQQWIDNALSTAPADRHAMRSAVTGLYEAAGWTPPPAGRVVFVQSPFAAHIAGGIAAGVWWLRENRGQHASLFGRVVGEDELAAALRVAVRVAVGRGLARLEGHARGSSSAPPAATSAATRGATSAATGAATYAATYAATDAATRAATRAATSAATSAATYAATYAATRAATSAATGDATSAATRAATGDATSAATYAATYAATRAATDAATDAATHAATDAATDAATYAATYAATDAATSAATHAATSAATGDATSAATYAATDAATDAATRAATYAATYAATGDATGDATDDATYAATGDATDAATHAATYAATGDATRAATDTALTRFLLRCVSLAWRMHDGGSDWSAWPSYLSFFDRVAGLDLPVYSKWRHYEQAALNGASRIMHAKFCIVSDRQTSIHLDGQNRLHCADGPARTWGDGWALWYWHGVRVPRDLIESGWDIGRILREENAEVRRCAIERAGWDRFITEASLRQVGEAVSDPGNPGKDLVLYDVPERIYGDTDVRVLLCTNGTIERDGTRRRFGLTVPADMPDPITAAAWTYGMSAREYVGAQRRT